MSGRWQMRCQNAGGEYVGPVLAAESGMTSKKRNSAHRLNVQDFIKANRKASREEEIAAYGSQVSFRRVLHKSRKQYDRKRLPKIREED